MTESEARQWLRDHLAVSRETESQLECFVALLRTENQRQNLVSPASLDEVWARHILDSAQLLDHAPVGASPWIDIGAGGGLPGLILAICAKIEKIVLVEPRRLRAAFLRQASETLALPNIEICQAKIEALDRPQAAVITARAFAPLDRTFAAAARLATAATVWILPRGCHAQSDLAAARQTWQGRFDTVASVTDPASGIVIARDVAPRECR